MNPRNNNPNPYPVLLPNDFASLKLSIIANTKFTIDINSNKNFQPLPNATLKRT